MDFFKVSITSLLSIKFVITVAISISSLLLISLLNKNIIKKCKNCGKYFITDNSRINYCNNLFKDKQTCGDIGNQIAQRIKQENEIIYGKYRKIYAKKAMLVKRNPDIEVYKKDYEKWKKEAKEFMDAFFLYFIYMSIIFLCKCYNHQYYPIFHKIHLYIYLYH